jgi:hypothetical protein
MAAGGSVELFTGVSVLSFWDLLPDSFSSIPVAKTLTSEDLLLFLGGTLPVFLRTGVGDGGGEAEADIMPESILIVADAIRNATGSILREKATTFYHIRITFGLLFGLIFYRIIMEIFASEHSSNTLPLIS